MISINMEKAREIWKNKIRADRQPYLDQLDIDFMIAVEKKDLAKQQEISNKKQLLRDATQDPRIQLAEDTDDLRNIDPIREIVS
jgi:signal recognition particle receptor subunit beta